MELSKRLITKLLGCCEFKDNFTIISEYVNVKLQITHYGKSPNIFIWIGCNQVSVTEGTYETICSIFKDKIVQLLSNIKTEKDTEETNFYAKLFDKFPDSQKEKIITGSIQQTEESCFTGLRSVICEEFCKIDPKLSTEEFADKFSHNLEIALVKLMKETGPIKL